MIISNKTVKQALDWTGRKIHSPEQRLVLGATALATQPFIDLKNKDVDAETRKTSVARTLAKIVAGTLVGVAVRQAGISFVRKYSQYDPNLCSGLVLSIKPKKGESFFVPMFEKVAGAFSTNEKSIFPIAADKLEKKFELYRKAMGTFVATIAMIGTNFLLDAPLTKYFTGVFQKSLANVKLDENPVPKKEAEVKQ
mgnify:FL=1